jgi:hypothetical protein
VAPNEAGTAPNEAEDLPGRRAPAARIPPLPRLILGYLAFRANVKISQPVHRATWSLVTATPIEGALMIINEGVLEERSAALHTATLALPRRSTNTTFNCVPHDN